MATKFVNSSTGHFPYTPMEDIDTEAYKKDFVPLDVSKTAFKHLARGTHEGYQPMAASNGKHKEGARDGLYVEYR